MLRHPSLRAPRSPNSTYFSSALALFALSLVVPLAVRGGSAEAQFRRDSSPVSLPPVSIAAPDDVLALHVDPAALGYLSSWGVTYVHADSGDAERFDGRGDGIYAATPILFGISAGIGIDSVRPSPGAGIERTMLSLGLAWAMSETLSVGAAPRFLWSPDPRLTDQFTLDLAASWRPLPQVAASFIARDLTGPGYHGGGGSIPRSFLLALAVRPESTRALTFDLTGAVDERGSVGARLAAEVEVPYVGRAHAAAEIERVGDPRPDYRVIAGLAVDWGQIGAGGGVVMGDGFDGAPGWYVSARLEGARRRGIPVGDVVAEITIEGGGARGILSASRRLERALRDPRARGVILRPRGSGIGMAYAQELRLLVDELERAGKPVVCVLEDASGSELYACAGTRAIAVDPAGGIRLYGPQVEVMHFAELLQNLGVRADFVRIGRFKSAIEEFQDRQMSEGAREEREQILDDVFGRMTHDLSEDLAISEERVRALVDAGPYIASEAVDAGLATRAADVHELDDLFGEVFGGRFAREERTPDELDRRFGREARIGVVVIDGEIVDGENLDIPLLEIHSTGGRTAVEAIDRMAGDPAIAAIVVRIDSPGGSVLASDQIWRAISRARERKPVIASLGAVAASGGYYVASACDEIWADPATITGSIGVWFGKVDFEPIATRFGVEIEELRRGAHAGAESLFRPFSPEERAMLAGKVRQWYRAFLRRVSEARGMRMTEVHAVAQGRVWTGDRALELGLVDRLGGFYSALVRARGLAGLPDDAPIEVQPSRPSSILDYVLTGVGVADEGLGAPQVSGAEASLADVLRTLSPEVLSLLRTAYLMRAMENGEPVALLPWQMEL